MSRTVHARGAFLYRSKRTRLHVFASRCGSTDNLHSQVVLVGLGPVVTCKTCLRAIEAEKARSGS